MNGTRNEFLSRSCFTQNENCGIRWGYFGHLQQYLTQCFRGTDDFLEHGRVYDVFAQRNVFVSCPVFGPLAIVDVGSRCIPTHEASLFVAERVVTDEEPTMLPILPQRSLFDFKRETACKGRAALLPQPLEILRMKDPRAKVRGDHVFHGETGIVEDCLVRVDRRAVRVLDDNGLGYRVGNPAKVALVLPKP